VPTSYTGKKIFCLPNICSWCLFNFCLYIIFVFHAQEIITSFRYKLAAILLCWKKNTATPTTKVKESNYSDEDPDDVVMSDRPFDQNESKDNNSLSVENKYQSLISVLSNLSVHELVGGLCNYIKSVTSGESLK
jgi:hypothetical protein